MWPKLWTANQHASKLMRGKVPCAGAAQYQPPMSAARRRLIQPVVSPYRLFGAQLMLLKPADRLRLRRLPLFATATEDTFARLARAAFLQRFTGNVLLTAEGELNDFLFVLMEGAVELEGTWHDRDTTLAVLRPLSTFVLASAMLQLPALMTARTIEPSQVLMIPGEPFRDAVRADSALGFAVAEELSGCYSGVVRVLKGIKLRGAQERLANFLVVQQRRQGGGQTLQLPYPKRVLASLLGMTPENLSRAFSALAALGVEVKGATVRLTRPEALLALARPDALIDDQGDATAEANGRADRERSSFTGAEHDASSI